MKEYEQHDLDWLAFRYVAGEMPAAELSAFEDRLADDQPAREAVARAAQLAQTVALAAAPPQVLPAAADRSSWLQPAAWMSMGAAACLAVVLYLNLPAPGGKGDVAGVGDNADGAAVDSADHQLASIWAAGRDDLAEMSAGDADDPLAGVLGAGADPFTPGGRDAEAEIEEENNIVAVEDAAIAPSSWLLLAVHVDQLSGEGPSPPEEY